MSKFICDYCVERDTGGNMPPCKDCGGTRSHFRGRPELDTQTAELDRHKAKIDDLILSNIVNGALAKKAESERDALIDAVQMAVVAIDDKQYPAVHGELIAALNKIKEG